MVVLRSCALHGHGECWEVVSNVGKCVCELLLFGEALLYEWFCMDEPVFYFSCLLVELLILCLLKVMVRTNGDG